MVARLGARLGRLCVGGLAVCVSYRLANSTIELWAERTKYSKHRVAERIRQRPAGVELRRDLMLDRVRAGARRLRGVQVPLSHLFSYPDSDPKSEGEEKG